MGDYLTSEVAAWLDNLQAADAKTADLVDDAIYTLAIPHAEQLYEIHLKERAEEEESGR